MAINQQLCLYQIYYWLISQLLRQIEDWKKVNILCENKNCTISNIWKGKRLIFTCSVFSIERQKVFAYSLGLKDLYELKYVSFFHFVWVILIFGFKVTNKNIFCQNWGMWKKCQVLKYKRSSKENFINFPDWFYFCSHF